MAKNVFLYFWICTFFPILEHCGHAPSLYNCHKMREKSMLFIQIVKKKIEFTLMETEELGGKPSKITYNNGFKMIITWIGHSRSPFRSMFDNWTSIPKIVDHGFKLQCYVTWELHLQIVEALKIWKKVWRKHCIIVICTNKLITKINFSTQ